MKRKSTGDSKLDQILKGGIPENSIELIIGLPGTGKTILAESILNRVATPTEKGLYISTSSETLGKLLSYAQGFTFFKPEAIGHYIFYEQVGDALRSADLESVVDRIIALVKEFEPSYLVIDSFKAFHSFGATLHEVSAALTKLSFSLSAIAVTSFWVGEYSFDGTEMLPEFAIADSIMELFAEQFEGKMRRYLRVIKMRGADYLEGKHTFNIDREGLHIYPRLIAPGPFEYRQETARLSTGIDGLDLMTEGGLKKGSTTAVFGPPGAGKTVSALHFIFKGIEEGEKGLYVTLTENPTQLVESARALGWDIDKALGNQMLHIHYYSPDNVYIDQVSTDILEMIEQKGVKRVVIDSMNDLESSVLQKQSFSNYVYALTQHMVVNQVSLWMAVQTEPLYSVSSISQLGASHMADNVIFINYEKPHHTTKRYVTILKTRGQPHEPKSRPARITAKGMTVSPGLLRTAA